MGTKRESDFSKRQASLLPALKLLTTHLTQELCKAVFQKVRLAERDRKWSLTALVMFWTEVVIRAPQSLTQALQEVAPCRRRSDDRGVFREMQGHAARFFLGSSGRVYPVDPACVPVHLFGRYVEIGRAHV